MGARRGGGRILRLIVRAAHRPVPRFLACRRRGLGASCVVMQFEGWLVDCAASLYGSALRFPVQTVWWVDCCGVHASSSVGACVVPPGGRSPRSADCLLCTFAWYTLNRTIQQHRRLFCTNMCDRDQLLPVCWFSITPCVPLPANPVFFVLYSVWCCECVGVLGGSSQAFCGALASFCMPLFMLKPGVSVLSTTPPLATPSSSFPTAVHAAPLACLARCVCQTEHALNAKQHA